MRYADFEQSTKAILKVIFAALVLVFLWQVREIVVLLLLSIILASALEPLVDYLKAHRIPRSVSVLAVYIFILGLVGFAFYSIIPLFVEQSKNLIVRLPDIFNSFNARFGAYVNLGSPTDLFGQFLSGLAGDSGSIVSSTFGIFSTLIAAIAVLVISFYLVAEQDGMKRFVSSFVLPSHHDFTANLLHKIQRRMGLWVLGQLIASVVMFLITWAGLSLLHVQFALVLAVIAGLLEVVPYIGPIVSAIPAVFFALIQVPGGGLGLALVVMVLYFVLHEIEGYILIPKIMEKTVGGSPLMILLAILIGFKLYGVVGIVIAVPLVGALNVTINEFWPGRSV